MRRIISAVAVLAAGKIIGSRGFPFSPFSFSLAT